MALSPALALRWTSRVLANWVTAALEARYEYHPPALLSVMEPTRADMSAKTALFLESPWS